MHSGFANLRTEWPMNARARNRHTPMTPGLEADIERVEEIWNDCRRRFGAGGPWLFGEYSIADAMYAPVVLRFNTYGAQVSETARWYIATALEDAAMQEWVHAAQNEQWKSVPAKWLKPTLKCAPVLLIGAALHARIASLLARRRCRCQ